MLKFGPLMFEYLRKFIHFFGGLLIVLIYTLLLNFTSAKIAIWSLTLLLLLLLEIEYVRLEHRSRIVAMFDILFRKHEKDNIAGAVFFVISCIICFAVFDYWIAVIAMFMTVFGDMAAAIVGKTFGKMRILKKKTWVGTLSCFAANSFVGMLILAPLYYVILPMAIVATVVELLTHKLDDNLTVPLFSGFLGQMIVYFMQIELPPMEFGFWGIF